MPSRLPAWRRGVLPGALGLLLAACGGAAGTPAITVSEARIPQPAGPNGAAYMTMVNDGDGDDRLLAVETTAASSAQLHESTLQGGVMSMRQVDGIDVPAGGRALLEPGGFHAMLLDVDTDLAVGDTVTLTLTFEASGEQLVEAEVVPLIGGDTGSEHSSEHSTHDHSEMPAPTEG
jgi:periplasmic copper chaperone A